MNRFFLHIRQNLLAQNRFTRYLIYALGEILLVVIGILIALQINTWNAERKSKALERSTMNEIIENLRYDIVRCEVNSSNNTQMLLGLDSLRTVVGSAIKGQVETPSIIYFAMKYGQDYSFVTLQRSAYDQLINAGTIQLIDNRHLVLQLSDYYERKSFAVLEYDPKGSHANMKTIQRKFIPYTGAEALIQSFDTISSVNFVPKYEYSELLTVTDLQLMKPHDVGLDNYYNEIAQFEMDLKTYNFYLSWVKEAAEQLIVEIQSEYQMKDDDETRR